MLTRYARDIPDIWDTMDAFFNMFPSSIGSGSALPNYSEEVKDDVCTLSLDLPGVKQADLKVEQEEDAVRITGKRGPKEFAYTYRLPKGFDPGTTKGSLSDGVLTLTVSKSERTKARRIELQ